MINKKNFIPQILFKFLKHNVKQIEDSIPKQVTPHFGSFSQFQEDIILYYLLDGKQRGVYVDIGANSPITLNNTYFFYLKGWRGINVEPNPILFEEFQSKRLDDINLNIGVGEKNESLTFYMLEDDTISSFNYDFATKNAKDFNSKIIDKRKIEVLTLKTVMEKHLNGNTIDFLSIDVEGFDLEVLKGNDWDLYRPRVVLIESNRQGSLILSFMKEVRYELIFSNGCNSFFVSKELLEQKE